MAFPEKRCRGCGTTSAWAFDQLAKNECRLCRKSRRLPAADRAAPRLVKAADDKHPAHLAWIRTLGCLVPGCAHRPVDAHHVRTCTGGGMGKKPGDEWCIPLCHTHHMAGHQMGWRTFEARYGLDLREAAECFAARSPALADDLSIAV
jgi:hypothetical protein